MKHFEQGCAVVHPLMAQLVEAACDDPGAVLLPQLVLPLLRERLGAKAQAHKVFKVSENSVSHPCMAHLPALVHF